MKKKRTKLITTLIFTCFMFSLWNISDLNGKVKQQEWKQSQGPIWEYEPNGNDLDRSGTIKNSATSQIINVDSITSSNELSIIMNPDFIGDLDLSGGIVGVRDGKRYSLTKVEANAFIDGFVTSVNLPDVVEVGRNAFLNNQNLTYVDLPSLTILDAFAFSNCKKLESINMSKVSSIKEYAFQACDMLMSIDFPFVTSIGDAAFEKCTRLSSVNLPLVSTIGNGTFVDCESLQSIQLPMLIDASDDLFLSCINLKSVYLPKVMSIGDQTFLNCEKLAYIAFPKVKTVGNKAFLNCTSLSNLELPEVVSVGSYVTFNSSIKNISFPKLTQITNNAFENCVTLESVYLPKVTTVGKNSFFNCINLTEMNLPELLFVGDSAFENCNNLKVLNMPKVVSLGVGSLAYCAELRELSLPAIRSIEKQALMECTNLYNLEILTDIPPEIGNDVFIGNGIGRSLQLLVKPGTTLNWQGYPWNTSPFTAHGAIVKSLYIEQNTKGKVSASYTIDGSAPVSINPGSTYLPGGAEVTLTIIPNKGRKFITADILVDGKNFSESIKTSTYTFTAQVGAPKIENILFTNIVNLDATGGNVDATILSSDASGRVEGPLPIPSKKGYTFLGWFTKQDGGKQIKQSFQIIKDVTLYAHWKKQTVSGPFTGDSFNTRIWLSLVTISGFLIVLFTRRYKQKYRLLK